MNIQRTKEKDEGSAGYLWLGIIPETKRGMEQMSPGTKQKMRQTDIIPGTLGEVKRSFKGPVAR
jgi:hypothetical protein